MKKILIIFVLLSLSFGNRIQKFKYVPDTLDLRENARLSINFLKGTMDMHQGGVTYFNTYFGSDPTGSSHKYFDLDEIPGRFLYGFVSARQVTGSIDGIEHEQILKKYLFSRMIHNDGLVYLPKYSLMCSVVGADSAWMWGNRSVFMGLLSLYMVSDNPKIKIRLDKAVNTLYRLAVKHKDGFYLSQSYYSYESTPDNSKRALVSQNMSGWITPLIKYYEWTGNKKAFELARGFANYIVKHHKESLKEDQVLGISNVHGALFCIGGVLRVARLTGNLEYIEWSKKLIDYAVNNIVTSFGWLPEHEGKGLLKESDTQSCEGCAVADLINCCIYLAKNGYPEYWNYVERYTRNYLEEAQLKNTDWMPNSIKLEDNVHESYDNIPERIKGAYVGWGDPNDFVNPTARARNSIQNCCGPHCAWATFLVWNNIVTKKKDGIYINISLNKRSPLCEVLSYRPYKGKIVVEMFIDDNLYIRIPGWVNKSDVRAELDGVSISSKWKGDYLKFANLSAGDKVAVNYPMKIITIKDSVKGKGVYATKWKGDTVVSIDPLGRIVPLFQREYFLSEECPMKKERVLEKGARVGMPLVEIDW